MFIVAAPSPFRTLTSVNEMTIGERPERWFRFATDRGRKSQVLTLVPNEGECGRLGSRKSDLGFVKEGAPGLPFADRGRKHGTSRTMYFK
jgi:hypothetical protein